MPNPYPIQVQAGEGGPVVVVGEATFTDPANQPGGGGSQPPVRLALAYNTPGLAAGIVVWTPTVDSWLLDAWFEVTPGDQWDGTTPFGDIGIVGEGTAIFKLLGGSGSVPMDQGTGWVQVGGGVLAMPQAAPSSTLHGYASPDLGPNGDVPLKVPAGTPIAVWVSQDGNPGGADPGASQGSGAIVLNTAPV